MKIKKAKAAAEEISIDAAVAATGRRFRIEKLHWRLFSVDKFPL